MTPRIILATPTRDGAISALHYASAWPLMGANDIRPIDPQILIGDDLVRTRSRIVRIFLQETDGTHLLFWDADVGGDVAACLRGMVAAGVDCIGATYPKKLLDERGRCTQAALYTAGRELEHDGVKAVVPAVGLGFTLITRALLEAMVAWYRDELVYVDGADNKATVALFQLMFGTDPKHHRRLWPEDYSFCFRTRWYHANAGASGASVHLYTGPGSPLDHQGTHVFRMRAEDVHPGNAKHVRCVRPDCPIDPTCRHLVKSCIVCR